MWDLKLRKETIPKSLIVTFSRENPLMEQPKFRQKKRKKTNIPIGTKKKKIALKHHLIF